MPTDTTLAQKFVDAKVDLIIAIGTPAATAAAKVTQSGKGPTVLFATVTDPYGSGIATATCIHPAWITGIQGLAPVDQSIALLQKVAPSAKTIGYITNPAETNSVATTKIITPLLDKAGLKLDTQTIAAKGDVAGAAAKLVADKVDAIFIGSDNTVESAISDVISAATAAKIPVFSVNPTDAAVGGVASLGLDYKQIGIDTGRLAGLILNKKIDVSKTKIVNATATQLAVNTDAAKSLSLTLPTDVLSSAALTYAGGAAATPAALATVAATTDDDFATAHTCSAADLAATPAATMAATP